MDSMGLPPLAVLERMVDVPESIIYEAGDVNKGDGIRISLKGDMMVVWVETPDYEGHTALEINGLLAMIGEHTRKYAQA